MGGAIELFAKILDYLVGKREERGGHGETERLCGFQIDDEIKFDRLLNRQFGRLGTPHDLGNDLAGLSPHLSEARPIREEPTSLGMLLPLINRWEPVRPGKIDYLAVDGSEERNTLTASARSRLAISNAATRSSLRRTSNT